MIDKYTQIPRILAPIIDTVRQLDELAAGPGMGEYIRSTFGSVDECRMAILSDFFRHGFDGSGADNYYDAGSCIDGRLTSAWNWCSKLSKKKYVRAPRSLHAHAMHQPSAPTGLTPRALPSPGRQFHVFKLTGFDGFDGSFQK